MQRGVRHDVLGINVDYSMAESDGTVLIDQIPYIKNILREFPERLGRSKATPAPAHLFDVRPESKAVYLPEEQAICFHRFTAKLLFIAPQSRRDIQLPVVFLTT